MFITVNERPLNLFAVMYHYTRDVEKDGKTSYNMYYRLTDGRIIEEEFQDIELRNKRVAFVNAVTLGGLIQKDTYTDFPTTGGAGSIYLAKDTGQVYYYDDKTKIYEKIGTAGKTGVYSVNKALPQTIGDSATLNKADLTEIVKPSVDYSDGSEVIGTNSVHALIVSSDATTVTVKTVTDLVIDSFVQVATETNLPTNGAANILYYLQDKEDFRVWDVTNSTYVRPNSLEDEYVVVDYQAAEDPALFMSAIGVDKTAEIYDLVSKGKGFKIYVKQPNGTLAYTCKNLGQFVPNTIFFTCEGNQVSSASNSKEYQFVTDKYVPMYVLMKNGTTYSSSIGTRNKSASFLSTLNTYAYTPTDDYHPATKKYVDDTALANSGIFKIYEIDLPALSGNSVDISNYGSQFKQMFNECATLGKLPLIKSKSWRGYIIPTFSVADLQDTTKLTYYFCSPFNIIQGDTDKATVFGICQFDIQFTAHATTGFTFDSSSKAHIKWWYNYALNVLPLNNTYKYTPTQDYHPATKKYVDDSIKAVKEYTEDLTFDGTSDEFAIPANVVGNDFEVYINGFRLFETDDYTVDTTTNKIKFTMVYDTWDVCKFVYAK